jgi:hypothetical protein
MHSDLVIERVWRRSEHEIELTPKCIGRSRSIKNGVVLRGGRSGGDLSEGVQHGASVVLATGPGNPPAVRVCTGKTLQFSSRPAQKPDQELLGGQYPYAYPSTRGFCPVWLVLSVPVSRSPFRVFLFMVTVIYVTVMCKILTLVHHSLYWFHWQPLYSKQGETCSLLLPEVECDQVFILHNLYDSRSRIAILIAKAVIQPELDQFAHATAPTTF